MIETNAARSEQFVDEEEPSSYGYLSGYIRPRPVVEQAEILRHAFPGLGYYDIRAAEQPLPEQAEGLFAIPRPSALADSYSEALLRVLEALSISRDGKFYNNRGDQINETRLRQRPDTLHAWESIAKAQHDNDILIIPAQFGILHRGQSIRRARATFVPGEFPLSAVHVGAMLLTHPERLAQHDDLYIDCCGDDFDDAAADDRWGRTPCFCYEHDQLECGTHKLERVHDFNGSASGFIVN